MLLVCILEKLTVRIPKYSCRNVTVSGAKGTDTVLDQQFQRARLQLCGNCTWTYQNITVANDSRGSAAGNELFVAAELGARVILQDAQVLRLACPSPADTLGVLTITPRSAAFKDGQTQQQHSIRDISIQVCAFSACRPSWALNSHICLISAVGPPCHRSSQP